ncbi:DEAD/DEAH box helicase [Candidatus Bipolaricaulota bacterium]|nr:DEAD/DEAH box helicase [Candidatus Bipolaricaulota bacterium]
MNGIIAPGARVVIRDAEWLVRRTDRTPTGGQALDCVGLSEIVRDKEATFVTEVEEAVEVLRPEDTQLVLDRSSGYADSLVYVEGLLRQSPPTDDRIYVGHKGAMDIVPYQMDPAIQALTEPRQRILIADAVGLGKTIECGILLSELIKRGRGKRILVLAVKSMLTQFQKELWARFTIPLVRLDSIGIQRIRRHIPSNHNPFYYYDKAIISIDTLKREAEYRTYIENAYWDIIVIDEAQNVARRGTASMRTKLAKLIADRSDTLIMLSATPHDGKRQSFASLMNMLNPTAIADPNDYGPEDIRGLFIRRFKKDIKDQVASSFKERTISRVFAEASPMEEEAFEVLTQLQFARLDQRRGGAMLFKTTLEKALFSSPAACAETIRNRVRRLENTKDSSYQSDIDQLGVLAERVSSIGPDQFSKYQKLVDVIQASDWTGKKTDDRLVIFTERIETLRFLERHLPAALGLSDKQVDTLYGSLSDVEQQSIVERFGREADSLRLLIASDVASEGINLHYLCHRMIHFDIPWSLMVFQQRNGRIDRYGQTETPQITYLITQSDTPKIKGDLRILELLTEKDDQVVRNIGDPSEFTGIYDRDEEELKTATAMEDNVTAEEFEQQIEKTEVDPLAILLGDIETTISHGTEEAIAHMPTLFPSTFDYFKRGLEFVGRELKLQHDIDEKEQVISLTVPGELEQRLRFLPPEIEIKGDQISLTADRAKIQQEIARCRKEDSEWPQLHLLWEQHPVSEWINDKVLAAFRRHEAPVLAIPDRLKPTESIFIVSGLIPNQKGHPLIHPWFGLRYRDGAFDEELDLDDVIRISELGKTTIPQTFSSEDDVDLSELRKLLPFVVEAGRAILTRERTKWRDLNDPKLQKHLDRLDELRERRHAQLELGFQGELSETRQSRRDADRRQIDRLFDEYWNWIEQTMTTEDNPYLRIAAVLWGGG